MKVDVRVIDPDGRELIRWTDPEPAGIRMNGGVLFVLDGEASQGEIAGIELVYENTVLAQSDMPWNHTNRGQTIHIEWILMPVDMT